jgi:release factor glutamine methyltransferase
VDRSPAAAVLAAANAAALGLSSRTAFFCGDWAEALDTRFDLILCNPPYIPTSEFGGLMPEVARHEPRSALDGGADGLTAHRQVIASLPRLLRPDGVAILELGMGQARDVAGLAAECGFLATTWPDLAGIPRAMLLQAGSGEKKPFGSKAAAG